MDRSRNARKRSALDDYLLDEDEDADEADEDRVHEDGAFSWEDTVDEEPREPDIDDDQDLEIARLLGREL